MIYRTSWAKLTQLLQKGLQVTEAMNSNVEDCTMRNQNHSGDFNGIITRAGPHGEVSPRSKGTAPPPIFLIFNYQFDN